MSTNVLIVDDSPVIRKILQRVLRQTEMPLGSLYEAGDGVQALEALKNNSVDLVLSDINMPNMDGLQLLAQIRANPQWQGLRVLVITSEADQAKLLDAVGLGAAGYVRKPFTADEIKEKLLSVL
jgi:two-component system chemotaxis response regulator CheY